MENIIGVIIIWIIAILMLIAPEKVLEIQKGFYQIMGMHLKYTNKTIKIIRVSGLILFVVGIFVFFLS